MSLRSAAEWGGWSEGEDGSLSFCISPPLSPSWGWQDHLLSSALQCGANLKLVPCERVWWGSVEVSEIKQDSVGHGVGLTCIYSCWDCVWVQVVWGWWYGLDLELCLEQRTSRSSLRDGRRSVRAGHGRERHKGNSQRVAKAWKGNCVLEPGWRVPK